MIAIDANELWRQIPPEEKLELMAKAQSRGFGASIILIIICCTLAVGMKFEMLMWASFVVTPLIFQFASGRSWRESKPTVMLEYLAARAAARRYAFAQQSKDLAIVLIFRGHLEYVSEEGSLDQLSEVHNSLPVWITLFHDTIIIMCERAGGAELCFGALINSKLTISSESPNNKTYEGDRAVYLSSAKSPTKVKITSRYPAALVVFERKILESIEIAKQTAAQLAIAQEQLLKEVDVDEFDPSSM